MNGIKHKCFATYGGGGELDEKGISENFHCFNRIKVCAWHVVFRKCRGCQEPKFSFIPPREAIYNSCRPPDLEIYAAKLMSCHSHGKV